MVLLWERQRLEKKGRRGRWKWDERLQRWAERLGIDLGISPSAHRIMLQGLVGLQMNTRDNVDRFMSSSKGAEEYLKDLSVVLNKTRETKRLGTAARSIRLDFSAPTYIE